MKRKLFFLNLSVFILSIMVGTVSVKADESSEVVDISGYYDFTYVDDTKDGSNGTFRQHHFSLFAGKEIGKFRVFSELEWEFGPKIDLEGGKLAGGTDKAEVLLETAWLEYNYSNWLTIRTGKHLTPFGYWNINHYPILALTTSRPESSKWIFPATTTGIQVFGSIFFGETQADYNIYIANDVDNNATNERDKDEDKAIGGRIAIHLPILDRFELGVSALNGRSKNEKKNQIFGFDEFVQFGHFELLGEYALNSSEKLSDNKEIKQKGYYIQPAFYLPVPEKVGTIALIFRHEFLDRDDTKHDSKDETENTFAINYKPIPDVALKGEFTFVNPEESSKENYKDLQFSVTIFF